MVARPVDLVGEFSPNGMQRIIAFGKQTDSSMGAMLASAFPNDGTFPVAYFLLDPNKYAHPIVQVKPIKAGKPPTTPTEKLITSPDGAYMLVGTDDAVKDISAYAFAVLARHDGAAWPTATRSRCSCRTAP